MKLYEWLYILFIASILAMIWYGIGLMVGVFK